MSGTQATADQPSFHPSNVIAHPGSSAAGIAIAGAVVNAVQANGIPTTGLGWAGLLVSIASAVLAVLGK